MILFAKFNFYLSLTYNKKYDDSPQPYCNNK